MQLSLARLLGAILGLAIALALSGGASSAQTACPGNRGNLMFVCGASAEHVLPDLVNVSALVPPDTVLPHRRPPAVSPVADQTQGARTAADDSAPPRTIVSQIHNAPGWRHSHTYAYRTGPYTRVVNGPGWNEAPGTYNPGQTLDAYQLTSSGSCVSAGSGGPTGTGSDIIDGTCRWKYLSRVDYISITGWSFDNQHWKSGTAYPSGDYVVSDSPLRAYEQATPAGCMSTVAPTGTASGRVEFHDI